jgi:[protein-PII] uridylyltransferase
LENVALELRKALQASDGLPPTFRRVWRSGTKPRLSGPHVLPTQVRIDNSTSERYTIVDVFAEDRTGLLYTITHSLYELGLSVSLAKIATHLDQVVDVFYVTDRETDEKVADEDRILAIRARLLAEISALEEREIGRSPRA